MKIYIIHGTYGNPNENWIPWLKKELEEEAFEVITPEFPTPDHQSLDSWLDKFKQYHLDKDTILVGHSLAPAFILSVLEHVHERIKASFLVAGFLGKLGTPEFDNLNRSFLDKEFDWDTIRKNCKKFYVYNSDDDPYVPLEMGAVLADKLGTKLKVVHKAGHFNDKTGYKKFPQLFKDINKELTL